MGVAVHGRVREACAGKGDGLSSRCRRRLSSCRMGVVAWSSGAIAGRGLSSTRSGASPARPQILLALPAAVREPDRHAAWGSLFRGTVGQPRRRVARGRGISHRCRMRSLVDAFEPCRQTGTCPPAGDQRSVVSANIVGDGGRAVAPGYFGSCITVKGSASSAVSPMPVAGSGDRPPRFIDRKRIVWGEYGSTRRAGLLVTALPAARAPPVNSYALVFGL